MGPSYISKEEVSRHLPMETCIQLMKSALLSVVNGTALQPLRSIMWLPEKIGGLGMMPGYSADKKIIGIKVISVYPENRKVGLSSHQGVVLLFESVHGKPLAFVDADAITAIRTAAVSGLATKVLSRNVVSTLAILGSGTQAHTHVDAMMCVRTIRSIKIWSPDREAAKRFASEVEKKHRISSHVVQEARDAITDSDIICTTTGSPTPILSGDWLKKGAHINAVGACTPATRELDTATIVKSKLYTDKYESLYREAGDFIIPKNEGVIDETHAKGELGEVLKGVKKGRESDDEITLFKSLGIAIEDIYAASHVFESVTKERNIG